MGYSGASNIWAKKARATFAPTNYGSDNPYISGAKEAITPGKRQENWKDILQYGEHSDTEWRSVIRENLKQLKKNYEYRGEWLKTKDWHKTDQLLWNATFGSRMSTRAPKGYDKYVQQRDAGRLVEVYNKWEDKKSWAIKTDDKNWRAEEAKKYSEADVRVFDKWEAAVAHKETTRKESLAKWIAEYNRNVNKVELANIEIEKTNAKIKKQNEAQKQKNEEIKVRNVNIKRFEQMQIDRNQAYDRGLRKTQRRGIMGLVVDLNASGLGIPA